MGKVGKVLVYLSLPLLVIGIFVSGGAAPELPPQTRETPIAAREAPKAATLSKPSEPNLAKTVVSAQIRQQFDTSDNYAAFIHDAQQRPSEGGRFYAELAYLRCTTIAALRSNEKEVVNGNPAAIPQATKRIEDLKRRCTGVQGDHNGQVGFAMRQRYLNRKTPDALMLDKSTLGPATNPKEIAEQLRHAHQSGDPYLIGGRLEQYAGAFAPMIDPAYAGDSPPTAVFNLAVQAALCSIVGDCLDNLELHKQCYALGECQFSDMRLYLRAQLPEKSGPLFDKTLKALLKIAGKG